MQAQQERPLQFLLLGVSTKAKTAKCNVILPREDITSDQIPFLELNIRGMHAALSPVYCTNASLSKWRIARCFCFSGGLLDVRTRHLYHSDAPTGPPKLPLSANAVCGLQILKGVCVTVVFRAVRSQCRMRANRSNRVLWRWGPLGGRRMRLRLDGDLL